MKVSVRAFLRYFAILGVILFPLFASTSLCALTKYYVTNFTISGSTLVAGSNQTLQGTVTINTAAPSGGIPLHVGCTSSCDITTNGGGYIPAGSNTTTFAVYAPTVIGTTQTATLKAAVILNWYTGETGPGVFTDVTVEPLTVTLSLGASTLVGGSPQTASGTVTLNAPAGSGGINVGIGCANSCDVTVSGGYIPAGSTSSSLTISAPIVIGTTQTATLIAGVIVNWYTGARGPTTSASITVEPYTVTLSISPSSLIGGTNQTAKGTATLNAPANSYGISYRIGCSSPCPIRISGGGYVAAGSTTSTFTVSAPTAVKVDTTVTMTAGVIVNWYTGALGPISSTSFTVKPVAPPDTPDLGTPNCKRACVGDPINITNGNTYIEADDYNLHGLGGGLTLKRTWNSLWQPSNPLTKTAMFGSGWSSSYEERLQVVDPTHIKFWRDDGSFWQFALVNGAWALQAPADEHVNVSFDSGTTLYTLAYRDGSKKIFNNAGYLVAIQDRNGNTTTLSYDGSNHLLQVTDAAGRQLHFSYGDANNPNQVTAVTDAVGTVASYAYDASEHLLQVTYADGSSNQYVYDSKGLITSVLDSDGKVLEEHTYDSQRRGLSSERANGVDLVNVSYPASGSTQITDSMGDSSTYGSTKIAGWGNVTSVTGTTCASCGAQQPASYTYDAEGNTTSSTDALGHVTHYTYDSMGDVLTKSIDVGSQTLTWSYTYNGFGEVLTSTDPMGATTTNTYDTNGNLLSTTTPAPDASHAGSTTSFAYDSKGELVQVTDPRNNVTKIAYNADGLVSSITDAQGNTTSYQYDARGNRISATDALGNVTTYAYDARNRLIQVTNPDQSTMKYTYDTRGRRTSATDGNGETTTYAYDDADRLVTVTDAADHATQYAYDTENNLTSITDANGHQTTFAYDNERRVISTAFPSQLTESYAYDADGNMLSKTDRNGNSIHYSYDDLNRLLSKQYPDGTTSYTYDADGRPMQIADATGTYGFTYDQMGRLTGTTVHYSFLPGSGYSVSYSYDSASNRTAMTDPQGGMTSYAYDTLNRLTSLTDPQSNTFRFSYDALGRRTGLARSNGVSTAYQYDSLSRLLSVLDSSAGGSVFDGSTYTYDNAGNRLTKSDSLKQGALSWQYAYDAVYQLTQALGSRLNQAASSHLPPQVPSVVSSAGGVTENYSFDQVGNRLSSQMVPSYTYNEGNELVSDSGAQFTYDNDGNMLTKSDASGVTQYAWDYANHLTSVTLPGGEVVMFKYDPMGRRIEKTTASGSTVYLYDGANVLEELDATGAVTARYTNGLGIDEPLAVARQGATSFYDADGLGSITSLTGTNGAVSGSYSYDSFGNLIASQGKATSSNSRQYTGREWDSETGLYYYRARYYDPTIGRFISEDPIGFLGSGTNFYAYIHNDPVNLIDPHGLCACSVPTHAGYANINQNIDNARLMRWLFPIGDIWWYNQVRNKGPWDYKQDNVLTDTGSLYRLSPFDDFGNFNYGATGAAMGIPLQVLLRGAGWAQMRGGNPNPKWGHWYGKPPYGDDPEGQEMIKKGYDYYKNCYH